MIDILFSGWWYEIIPDSRMSYFGSGCIRAWVSGTGLQRATHSVFAFILAAAAGLSLFFFLSLSQSLSLPLSLSLSLSPRSWNQLYGMSFLFLGRYFHPPLPLFLPCSPSLCHIYSLSLYFIPSPYLSLCLSPSPSLAVHIYLSPPHALCLCLFISSFLLRIAIRARPILSLLTYHREHNGCEYASWF